MDDLNSIFLTDKSLKKLFEGLFSISPKYDSETQVIDFKLPHPTKTELLEECTGSGPGFIDYNLLTNVPR